MQFYIIMLQACKLTVALLSLQQQCPPTIPSPPHPVPSPPHPVRRHRRAKPSSVPRDPGSRPHSLAATRPCSSQRGEARPRFSSCDDTRPRYDKPRPRHSSFSDTRPRFSSFDDARPHCYDNCPRGVASPPFFDSRPPPPWREDGWPHSPPLPHSVMYDCGPHPPPGVKPHPSGEFKPHPPITPHWKVL